MKVIVISGASSGVGKTTLARQLQRVLENAEVVKIGHGKRKPDIGNHFYTSGTPFQMICENHSAAEWLIVESNSILREIQPDLVIYLEGGNPKPSAQYARCRADIVSGRAASEETVAALADRLGITVDSMRVIVQLVQGASRQDR
jgi:thymidylate kinase